jgi:hypothetical protein
MSARVLAGLAAAVLLLNASLTFKNVWPTPAIRLSLTVSPELMVCLLLFAWLAYRGRTLSTSARRALAALWTVLVMGRYADVTAPALYGREVNLYWDLQHVSNVAAMLARAAPPWLVVAFVAAAAAVVGIVYTLSSWALARAARAMPYQRVRRVTVWTAAVSLLLFVGQEIAGVEEPEAAWFSYPVTASYTRHIRLAARTLSARSTIAASPSMESDLARIRGADVLLVFVESYGAVSWERPEFSTPLEPARADVEAAIEDSGRKVVSAFVESPTFGGGSWLAHISLLSGVEIREPDDNALLMAEKRETLVTAFARGGYRTVAVMPGMWQNWPEGIFYGFDEIHDGPRLDYRGPEFGWWALPDQFTMARMNALELDRQDRPPMFVFFPTINTHAPFSPTPPYQPDWPRLLTDSPYERDALDRSYAEGIDWLNLGPSYLNALRYTYATIGGYLRERADQDLVMLLVGDHQPPAAVTGEGASWDVPIHIITNRDDVIDRLREHGFSDGFTPYRPGLGPMHALVPLLLDAFGESGATGSTEAAQ